MSREQIINTLTRFIPQPEPAPPPPIDPLWVMGMLHDLGSPIRMIDQLVTALGKPQTQPQVRTYAEHALPAFVHQASTRLEGMWDVLKATTGPLSPERTPVIDLGEQVHIGVALLRPYVLHYLNARDKLRMPTISVGVLKGAVPVRAFDSMIHRMIENLVFNSIEAGAGHVRLTVTIVLGEALLVVHDTGPGFPDPVLAQITPGYTTKADGHGIGLAAVAANARRLGGSVELENLSGALVTIKLPLVEGPVE